MPQLNVELDTTLMKRVKMACIEDNTKLKKWVSAALELVLDFDKAAMARCHELGWIPAAPPGAGASQQRIEIIEPRQESEPSKPKQVKKGL